MALAVLHSAEEWTGRFGDCGEATAVTIGNFDGVHKGHQRILRRVRDVALSEKLSPAVLTFYPHPARVLRPSNAPLLLMTLDQRLASIEATGIEAALVIHFDEELAKVSPEDFVRRFLVETMRAKAVLIGGNFRFGHKQAGDAKLLADLGRRWGFETQTVPPVIIGNDNITVSSTAIRRAIRDGQVAEARRMLGRPFALAGEIRPGTGQGRKLVVPTLNLSTQQELLPKNGVYATEAVVEGKTYHAATNVGVRPTFNGAGVSIESHLLDFDKNLTGGLLEVRFWSRLRDEQKFPGPEALKQQILSDIERARDYFNRAASEA
jgi:riboflavin kinase / FMN adenylyltransferase